MLFKSGSRITGTIQDYQIQKVIDSGFKLEEFRFKKEKEIWSQIVVDEWNRVGEQDVGVETLASFKRTDNFHGCV